MVAARTAPGSIEAQTGFDGFSVLLRDVRHRESVDWNKETTSPGESYPAHKRLHRLRFTLATSVWDIRTSLRNVNFLA